MRWGWGNEASRPPDFDDPEDKVAYPYGVIYEDEPGYWPDDDQTGHDDRCPDETEDDAGTEEDNPALGSSACDLDASDC